MAEVTSRALGLPAAKTSPEMVLVVILIISSTDFEILSCKRLINSGFVIPCMNPEIHMTSGSPFTSLLLILNLRTKSSVDSPSLCLIWCISTGSLMHFYADGNLPEVPFSEASYVPLERELCLWNTPFSSLLNTVFLSGSLFLGDLDRPHLGSGLSDTLRIRLDPSLFLRSLLRLGVPDSECSRNRPQLVVNAMSNFLRAASVAGPFRFPCNVSFSLPIVFLTADMGAVGKGPECVLMKLYEREQKWINDFVPMDSEMVKDSGKKDDDSQKQAESSKKRPRAEHDEESVK
ncbi:hypothetical protein Tco_0701563, partial [Tanacetum coccineum]